MTLESPTQRHRFESHAPFLRPHAPKHGKTTPATEFPLPPVAHSDTKRDRLPLLAGLPTGAVAIDFLLLPGFDLHDLSAFTDVFGAANMVEGRSAFCWRLVGLRTRPVRSSSGIEVTPQISVSGIARSDNLVLLAGARPDSADAAVLKAWLQRMARNGSHLAAVGAGCQLLAEAGLLDGRDVSAHWSTRPAWEEIHHAIKFNDRIFSVGERLLTCCGGRGSIDLALHCVARHCSPKIAKTVGDQLNCDRVRDSGDRQTRASALRTRVWNAPLQRAITLMEQNLELPLTTTEISRAIKIGRRQLQRLFKQYADCTPNRYYLNCRLDRARALLRQVAMSITEVSIASGFTSSSHFSKCYKQRFGVRPSADRQAHL